MKMNDSEVEKLIRTQMPPQHTCKLTEGLDCMEAGKPFFTGWKGTIKGVDLTYRGPIDEGREWDIPDDIKIGYVAQWFVPLGDREGCKSVAVNLPGMEITATQKHTTGSVFDIGTKRVYMDTPIKELNRLIEEGHAKLMEIVDKEK